MKIIAKTEHGYLAELHETEIANIIGHYSTYETEFRALLSSRDGNLTGLEIDVAKMYDTARMLRGLNKDHIADAKAKLESTRKKLEGLEDIVNKMTLFDTLEKA